MPTDETPDAPALHPVVGRLMELLCSPDCQQVFANAPDRIFYVDPARGLLQLPADTVPEEAYLQWVDLLVSFTDVGQQHRLATTPLPVVEGSFLPAKVRVDGSLHVVTSRITRSHPAVTVRKQPTERVTLDDMAAQGMMTPEMRDFLVAAVRARANILVSGGSGAGKTTLARALALHVPPTQRICTVEEIDELAVGGHLPNSVAMTTWRSVDANGVVLVEVTLEQLVREALRMRPDRIWVGETRGQEASALVKACNSGHDGSLTTVHGDTGQQAVKQLVSYVSESHLSESAAADQVARAFHLVVQIDKPDPTTRHVTEITELEPVREGTEQRRNQLWVRDQGRGTWERTGSVTKRLRGHAARYGVDLDAVGHAPAHHDVDGYRPDPAQYPADPVQYPPGPAAWPAPRG